MRKVKAASMPPKQPYAKILKMTGTLFFTVLIIAIAMILLCVKVIFRKNGRFSSQHVKDNEALRKKGIHCVIDQDREEREKRKLEI